MSDTGYGIAAYNIYKELIKQGVRVALQPKGNYAAEKKTIIQEGIDNLKSFNFKAPCLQIWHQYSLETSIGRGKYSGFPFFELDRLEKHEAHNIRYPDQLFVASEWAKTIAEQYRPQDVFVVPLGIDPSIFLPAKPVEKRNYVFLNVGKWEIRKGHDVLVDIFNKAFSPSDNVELWMLPANVYFTEHEHGRWSNKYLQSPMGAAGKIKIWPWQKTTKNVVDLINHADCGIFPARAEGWNLELLEMICLGKPVITTNYSAHTQFCNDKNAFLVPYRKSEKAYDGKWFYGQGSWMYISKTEIEMFVEYMRKCYQEKILINQEGLDVTRQQYTWENTTKRLLELL